MRRYDGNAFCRIEQLIFMLNVILNTVSCVISGLLSYAIASHFYRKERRSAFKQDVIFPIKNIARAPIQQKENLHLSTIKSQYSYRYASDKEKEVIDSFIQLYSILSNETELTTRVKCLRSYFEYALKCSGENDLRSMPVVFDGEIVDYDYPDELEYLNKDIEAILTEELTNDDINTEDELKAIFEKYKLIYTNNKINWFKNYPLSQIVQNSRHQRIRKEYIKSYKDEVDKILALDD